MNTKKVFGYGLLAVIIALFLTGCDSPTNSGNNNPTTITYTATQTGGTNGTADSTGIVFDFSASVDSLTAADITIGGTASKGSATLTGSGTTWTLSPITVNNAGTATVSISKTGIEAAAKNVTVFKAGQTAPNAEEPPTEVTVTNGSTLTAKLQWIQNNAQSNTIYTIAVNADEQINNKYSLSYTGKNAITVRLTGSGGEKTLSGVPNSHTALFTVETGVTLIFDNNITLQGSDAGTDAAPLVHVNSGGAFIMNTGAKISGGYIWFYSNYRPGAAVHVASNANFTMNGGEISGNNIPKIAGSRLPSGGAVHVASNGTFTMNNGKISDNGDYGVQNNGTFTMNDGEISSNNSRGVFVNGRTFTMAGGEITGNSGGGVYVEDGTFTMAGGEITGNTAGNGGGVYVYGGTFTMAGGEISGNTAGNGGGGVYVTNITKTGGTIYGYDADDTINSNVVKNDSGEVVNNKGHAVYVETSFSYRYRETTAGPEDNLDSSQAGSAGGWEN